MLFLIVEKDVCAKSLEYGRLLEQSDEVRLVSRGAPGSKRVYDPRVSWGISGGYDRYPNLTNVFIVHIDVAQ